MFFDPADSGLLANVFYGVLLIAVVFVMPGGIIWFVRLVRSKLVRFVPRLPTVSSDDRRPSPPRPATPRCRPGPQPQGGTCMTQRPVARLRRPRAALALALLATACGSSKSDDVDAATSTSAGVGERSAPPAPSGAFKVHDAVVPGRRQDRRSRPARRSSSASACPRPAPPPPSTPSAPAMKIAFDKVNAAGGIDGHKIELVAKDDGYEPARSVANTTQLIQQDKVFATVLDVGTPNVAGTRNAHEDDLHARSCGWAPASRPGATRRPTPGRPSASRPTTPRPRSGPSTSPRRSPAPRSRS